MKDNNKRELFYLTTTVLIFGLFFITFLLLNNAETRCENKIQHLINNIEQDSCMGACLNPYNIPVLFNYSIGGIEWNETK